MDLAVSIIQGIMVAATPLIFAAIGELVVEKAGVLNLGIEGMMVVGAIAGFAVTYETGSFVFGLLAAMAAGAAVAGIFAGVTQVLLANQVASGLALTMFGLGLAALAGQSYSGLSLDRFPRLDLPVLSELPVLGPLLFAHDLLIYLSLALVIGVWWFLNRTRAGLIVRAVGENHDAAHAIGYSVVRVRFMAILFGGATAGLGGAYLAMVQTPIWVEGMTAGRGWIALALVVFAAWRPGRALIGAYLFGGITIIQLHAQAGGVSIESQYLSMLPYLATIVVLVLMSGTGIRAKLNAPACLGRPFFAIS
ncbi:Nucleoside ABC transporter, permease protein 2 [hydrothermal vent metagenome]|uniref:Nucleoside ABC transporter, permease protein 2 n=1 Tax=hydrothermal vent metagenome TaxID=652676 RepID=A0A3B0U783_9ZZZZ